MFNNQSASGFYRDEDIKIGFILENPLNYELDDNLIWFSFEGGENKNQLDISQLRFYIIGKDYNVYNEVTRVEVEGEIYDDDNQFISSNMKTLVAFNFNPDFLYHETMLGFLYKPYDEIIFISEVTGERGC